MTIRIKDVHGPVLQVSLVVHGPVLQASLVVHAKH